jgi:hypothetical protein
MESNHSVPPAYIEQLQTVLSQLESETGSMYQITLQQFGHNGTHIVGNFDKRPNQIEVYNMDPLFQELNGVYQSKDEIVNKIKELRANDIFEETRQYINHLGHSYAIGKCKVCHSYNDYVGNSVPNHISSNCCQNRSCPQPSLHSKWDNVELSDGTIYQHNGGSLSICHTKGYYKFIS